MKVEDRIKLAHEIAKKLKVPPGLPCNWPQEIVIKLNAKKGWKIVIDERRKTYELH